MIKESPKFTTSEMALAKELANYENKWVAISKQGRREKVVASGDRITDAKAEADLKGIKNPTFRKVPSGSKILIAHSKRF